VRYDVCFVGLKCLDHLTRSSTPRFLGGIERQLALVGHLLAEEGLRVAFIVYDDGQGPLVRAGGVDAHAAYRLRDGWPGLRFVHPRSTRLWSAMRRVDARVFLQMGAGDETGRVALGRRLIGGTRSFAYLVASDADCVRSLPGVRHRRARLLYRYGLAQADRVVAQTGRQQAALESEFGTESVVLRLPIQPPASPPDVPVDRSVLWVGRFDPFKRVEMLLAAAEQCPELRFDVVGSANARSGYERDLLGRAARLANVQLHGRVSDSELWRLYGQASILCNTSDVEGFPTTFLEAWSVGLPVVTTFDPDGVVAAHGLGCVVSSLSELTSALRGSADGGAGRARWSQNALRFYAARYSPAACVPRLRELVASLSNDGGTMRR
jgi:glycosyltransferase involved in cell wall biosynthesis